MVTELGNSTLILLMIPSSVSPKHCEKSLALIAFLETLLIHYWKIPAASIWHYVVTYLVSDAKYNVNENSNTIEYLIIYSEVVLRVHALERSGLKFLLYHLPAIIDVDKLFRQLI